MNMELQKYLKGIDMEALKLAVGITKYMKLEELASKYMITEGKMFYVSKGQVREVVPYFKRW